MAATTQARLLVWSSSLEKPTSRARWHMRMYLGHCSPPNCHGVHLLFERMVPHRLWPGASSILGQVSRRALGSFQTNCPGQFFIRWRALKGNFSDVSYMWIGSSSDRTTCQVPKYFLETSG